MAMDTTIRRLRRCRPEFRRMLGNERSAVAEECRRALTTILRRSLKRTNWPPPLTPSQLSEYEWNVGESEYRGSNQSMLRAVVCVANRVGKRYFYQRR